MPQKQSNTYTNSPLIRLLAPLSLILLCPPFAMLLWYANVHLDGSYTELVQWIAKVGLFEAIGQVWLPVFFGTTTAWKIIGLFAATQLILMRVLPGKKYHGPLTPMGNTPEYTDNGLLAYIISLAAFFGLSYGAGLFNAGIVYDHFGEILGALNVSALFFCLFLYFKAILS